MAKTSRELQLIELKDMISQLNITIKALNDTIARNAVEMEKLRAENAWFKNKFFGSSSERVSAEILGQLNLFDEEDEKSVEPISPEVVEIKTYKRKKKPTLAEQFKDIDTKKVYIDTLSEEDLICVNCGTQMKRIGEEYLRTEVVYTPPKLERIEYYGYNYECPVCRDTEDPYFIKDKGTPALIEGSYFSESLLAYIAYRKYGLYIPLYRQEKDFEQQNAPISRTSMAHCIIESSQKYLQNMYEYFHRQLLKRKFIMMDETPMQVLKEDDRRAQTKSYFWVVRTGEDGLNPIILYNYTPTRAGANAKEFLNGIEPGFYLMVDGYQGYNVVKDTHRCCCWAHIRRYFFEAINKGKEKDFSDPAVQGLLYCDKLFAYERAYKQKGLSYKQIKNRRLKDQKPVIEGLLSWVKKVKPGSNSKLKKAITYLLNREDVLMTYLEDGRCSLSNNLSENSIRPVTVGRKNWLFSDTPNGARANMIYLSMIEMAKAYDLNIYEYLHFLFKNRPNKDMTDDELDQLAPWSATVQELCKNKTKEESVSETC